MHKRPQHHTQDLMLSDTERRENRANGYYRSPLGNEYEAPQSGTRYADDDGASAAIVRRGE